MSRRSYEPMPEATSLSRPLWFDFRYVAHERTHLLQGGFNTESIGAPGGSRTRLSTLKGLRPNR